MPTISARITDDEHKEILNFLKDDSIARWLRDDSLSAFMRTAMFKHMDDVKNDRR